MAAAIRSVIGRNSVESNIKAKLYERNHDLDDLFEIKTLKMKEKVKKGDNVGEDLILDDKGRKTVLKTGVLVNILNKACIYIYNLPLDCLCGCRPVGTDQNSRDWTKHSQICCQSRLGPWSGVFKNSHNC